ncbi:hypothetical protein E5345_09255 [Propionibacterium sp. NM47_B9-13]|nr:hypothetical protein CP877_12140 [Cutibacterium modestum]TGY28256.1 hypothetical protein E5345_09255 [Propionibacterium sp. NM47_B9-13]
MATRQIHEVPPWVERESSLTKSLKNVQMGVGCEPTRHGANAFSGDLWLVYPPGVQDVTAMCNRG